LPILLLLQLLQVEKRKKIKWESKIILPVMTHYNITKHVQTKVIQIAIHIVVAGNKAAAKPQKPAQQQPAPQPTPPPTTAPSAPLPEFTPPPQQPNPFGGMGGFPGLGGMFDMNQMMQIIILVLEHMFQMELMEQMIILLGNSQKTKMKT